MKYTHNLEVQFDGVVISGNMLLEQGKPSYFKNNNPEELSVQQHGGFQHFLEALNTMFQQCGDIKSITITKVV